MNNKAIYSFFVPRLILEIIGWIMRYESEIHS